MTRLAPEQHSVEDHPEDHVQWVAAALDDTVSSLLATGISIHVVLSSMAAAIASTCREGSSDPSADLAWYFDFAASVLNAPPNTGPRDAMH